MIEILMVIGKLGGKNNLIIFPFVVGIVISDSTKNQN